MITSNPSNPLQQQESKLMTQSENKENIPQPQAQAQAQDQDQTLSSKEVLVEEAPKNQDISTLIFSDSKGKSTSLQENFKKFRKDRNDKCKSHVNLRNKRIKERHTKEFQQELREKFVETAKKYLGVPYAKRHLTPEDENYNAPLFLDCCGLVRKVMTDLKEEFGFQIGGWNQAYQFDTLPVEVPFDQLKPGDLVFYSGTYFNPKKRKQKHDMVHVEIFLGGPTGEQTIGARYFKGVVSVFDSYKFNSKTYYDIKFYFRSLDTWLQGICKSACEEHLWLEDRDFYDSGKFSVFGEADAEASDGEDDGETAEETKTEKTKNTKAKTNNNTVKKIFIGKGNNDKLIKSYFAKDGYQVLDSNKMAFSDRFDLKWVQTTGEVDFLKFKEGSQLVNHIPNINAIGSKNGLIQTLRNFENQNPSADNISIDDFMPDSYRLDVLEDELKFANCENTGIWITKPYHTNQGKNLKIITDIAKFKKDFLKTKKMTLGDTMFKEIFNSEVEEEKEEDEHFQKIDTRVVIQKYIENPLLLNNKKFDIRCYVLITTMKPLFVLYHSGYCRLCIADYSTELNEKGQLDKLQHLTNNSVQKRHPDYVKHKEESIWTMSKFETYLQENNIADQAKINDLYSQIKNILAHCIKSADPVLEKKSGYFQLLGCDILIDQNLKPYLLEINSNPAIFTDIGAHKEVIPTVVFKALDIVIELNKKGEQLQDLLKNPEQLDLGTFEVLYNPL